MISCPFVVRTISVLCSPLMSLPLGYDDCSNDPCPSGTTCLDTKDGFTCICPPWQDDCTYCESNERVKTNETVCISLLLASNVGCSCRNGGRCMMGMGNYICECPYGYNGLSCETSECSTSHRPAVSMLVRSPRRHLYSQSVYEWWHMSIAGPTKFHMPMPTWISRTDLSDM